MVSRSRLTEVDRVAPNAVLGRSCRGKRLIAGGREPAAGRVLDPLEGKRVHPQATTFHARSNDERI